VARLEELASLIRELNSVGRDISAATGRPPLMGNVGEYITAVTHFTGDMDLALL
jgi:hypothetical protein